MLMQLHTPTVQPKCRTLNYQDYVQTITQSLHRLIYICACLASKLSAVMSPHTEPSSSQCCSNTMLAFEGISLKSGVKLLE